MFYFWLVLRLLGILQIVDFHLTWDSHCDLWGYIVRFHATVIVSDVEKSSLSKNVNIYFKQSLIVIYLSKPTFWTA